MTDVEVMFYPLRKEMIDEKDKMLAWDYIDYLGVQPGEYHEYADSFVKECYKFNEQTGQHEPRTPDELPFADITETDTTITYEYDNVRVTKQKESKC